MGRGGDPSGMSATAMRATGFSPNPSDISADQICADKLHEEWRKGRLVADGSFEPRLKTTTDQVWISRQGTDQVDIANTSFSDLPKDWQQDNLLAAKGAIAAIGNLRNNELLGSGDLESVASQIHDHWLERNGEWAEDHQLLPYRDLSEEEKEKDRVVARLAAEALGLSFQDANDFLPSHPQAVEYYDSLRAKHFSAEAVGSRFTDGLDLEDLVSRLPAVSEDRDFAEQDDRDYFESLGITGFKEDLGYFRIQGTSGATRLVPDSELDPDEPIDIEEVKPGFYSFITGREREVPVDEATVIVGRNPQGDPPFQLVTAFPGLPWEPERSGISIDEAAKRGIQPGRTTLRELQGRVGGGLLLQSR
jgi:hypothetical protein